MVLSGSEDLQSVLEPLYTTMECLISPFPSFLLKAVTLSTDTVLSSNAFHKSTTLALKKFCPSVPFLFLNNLYLCPRVTLLGANSKNLSDYEKRRYKKTGGRRNVNMKNGKK